MGSAYSNIVQMPVMPPLGVVLAVTPATSGANDAIEYSNTLLWNAIGASSQEVWRQINNGGYTRIAAALSGSATTFVDQATAAGFAQGQYDYYVRELDSDGNQIAVSNIGSVTWPRGDENPLQLELVGTSNVQQSTVYHLNTLTWNDMGAATYTVYRQINSGGFDTITQVGDATFMYEDEGIADSPSFPAGLYQYYVIAEDWNGVPIAQSATASLTWS